MSATDDEERRRLAEALTDQLRGEILPAAEMITSTIEATEGVSFGAPDSDTRLALTTGVEVGLAATLVVLQRRGMLRPGAQP